MPCSGKFKIESWGASGSTRGSLLGGYGGYAVGVLGSDVGKTIYVYVGGAANGAVGTSGYNGGGAVTSDNGNRSPAGSGGGATHVSCSAGLLSEKEDTINDVIIVAGGGGGANNYSTGECGKGGSGGGYIGNSGTVDASHTTYPSYYGFGGNQTSAGCTSVDTGCGSFGLGGSSGSGSGGGGGLYGGGGGHNNGGAGGGSGYIGNTNLISYGSVTKHMTGYNLTNTTTTANIRTQTTTCVSATATADCAKSGHGAARITIIE